MSYSMNKLIITALFIFFALAEFFVVSNSAYQNGYLAGKHEVTGGNRPTQDILNENKLMILVNGVRLENKINGVSYDDQLDQFANLRAKEVYENKETLHEGLSIHRKNGTLPSNCSSSQLGENIYFNQSGGQLTNKEVFDGWMNSPAHKPNLLNRNYETYGIGIYKNNVSLILCLRPGTTFEEGLN